MLSSSLIKQLESRKIPLNVRSKLYDWIQDVEERSLETVRKIPGYHDEPLKGKLEGFRSIRLNRSYRAYYRVINDQIVFIYVERVDKHEY